MENSKTGGLRHTVTAQNVTDTEIVIPTGGKQLNGATVQVRTAAGAIKAWDGTLVVAAESLTFGNGGAVDWAATDTIDIVSF